MSQPPERRLHASSDHRHAGECFSAALAVGERSAVGAEADSSAGGIGIVVADFLVGGVMVDEGIHVPRADREEQPGPTELPPRLTLRQSGWLSMATRKPACSRQRCKMAIAKLG